MIIPCLQNFILPKLQKIPPHTSLFNLIYKLKRKCHFGEVLLLAALKILMHSMKKKWINRRYFPFSECAGYSHRSACTEIALECKDCFLGVLTKLNEVAIPPVVSCQNVGSWRDLGWGLLKLCPCLPINNIFGFVKHFAWSLLGRLNHVHILQVSPQLSCGDICPIRTRYAVPVLWHLVIDKRWTCTPNPIARRCVFITQCRLWTRPSQYEDQSAYENCNSISLNENIGILTDFLLINML